MAKFISDADFEKNIGFAKAPPGGSPVFFSDEDFEKNIGFANEAPQESIQGGYDQEEAQKPSKLQRFLSTFQAVASNPIGGFGEIVRESLPERENAKAFAAGVEKGIRGVTRGTLQLGAKAGEAVGVVPEGTSKRLTEQENAWMSYYPELAAQFPKATMAGEIAGGTAATLPLGMVATPASIGGVALGATGRAIASGALQGAAVGGLQFDPENTWENRLENTAMGAGAGAILPAAGGVGKRILKGRGDKEAIQKTQELVDLSKEYGVDLTVPELRRSEGGQFIEMTAEKVPGSGYIQFRQKQLEQFQKAAEKTAGKIAKQEGDAGQAIQKSLQNRLEKNKAEAGKKFDKVERIAEQQGGKIEFNAVKQEAKNVLDELKQLPPQFRDQKLMKEIGSFSNLENLSFSVARKLRGQLGDEVSRLQKAANTGTENAQKYRYASKLFGALEEDMHAFTEKSGGALKQAYSEARKDYLDNVVPFKKGTLAKVIKEDYDTDNLIGAFLKPGKKNSASQLMKNLDKEGINAVRGEILANALEKASSTAENGRKYFNPGVFVKEANRLGKANKVVFTEEQRKLLSGYGKLTEAAERASKFAANPQSGSRFAGLATAGVGFGGGLLLGGGISTGYAGLLAGYGGLAMASKLLKSDAGRKLLIRANHLPEKGADKQWQQLLRDISRLAPAVAATQSGEIRDDLENRFFE